MRLPILIDGEKKKLKPFTSYKQGVHVFEWPANRFSRAI